MSNVYTTSIGAPRTARNKRIYGWASLTQNNIGGTNTPGRPIEVFDVVAQTTPTVSDYDNLFADVFGQYPLVRLIIVIDANTEYESAQRPQFTKVDGLIDTIFFDLGVETTGYIILQ